MVSVKKTAGWLLIAFAVFWVVTQPHQVANVIDGTVGLLHRVANSLSELIGSL